MASFKLENILFNGTNFPVWKIKIKAFLRSKKCLPGIEELSDTDKKDEAKVDAHKKMSDEAYGILVLCMHNDVFHIIQDADEGNAAQVWKRLKDHYERNTKANQLHLQRLLSNIKMKETDLFSEFSARIKSLTRQLKGMGITTGDTQCLGYLLNGLPEDFDPVVTAITAGGTCTFEKAVALIKDFALKKKLRDQAKYTQKTQVGAHSAEIKRECKYYKKGNCTRGKHCRYSHTGQRTNNLKKTKDGKVLECWKCGGNHYQANCTAKNTTTVSADFVEVPAYNASVDAGVKETGWIVDSGAGRHFCND